MKYTEAQFNLVNKLVNAGTSAGATDADRIAVGMVDRNGIWCMTQRTYAAWVEANAERGIDVEAE